MGRHADMPDFPCGLGFPQSFQRAAGSHDLGELLRGDVVNLIEVNVIRAQIFKALIDVRRHGLLRPGHGFAGQHEVLPDALQGVAQVFLADGIGPGSVDKIHPGIPKLMHQLLRPFRVNALNGNAAEAHPGDFQPGFSQNPIFHTLFSYFPKA